MMRRPLRQHKSLPFLTPRAAGWMLREMKFGRSFGLFTIVGITLVAASCRLGESLGDFTGGPTGSGASGMGGGSAGSSGAGTGGATGGTGGTSPDYVACDGTPSQCSDLGEEDVDRLYGCCLGNRLFRCEFDGTDWNLTSTNCETTGETCDYVQLDDAMGCTQGAAGSGGSSACESGECVGGCMDCDGTPSDCETDTNTDPDNCGECGHSCQGGTCSGGNCQAVVLAPNQKTPWGIAADTESVFWLVEGSSADDGSVFSVPVGGGTPDEIANGQNGPVQIAILDDWLFWTNFQGGGSVRRMNKDGTDLTTLAQASGPWALAAGSTHLYWTNTSDGSIRRVVQSGGQAVVLINGEDSPRGIAVDTTHVFWSTSGDGKLRRANLDGSADTTLVADQAYPLAVALDDEWVYWTEVGASYSFGDCSQADGRVLRARKADGSNLEILATNQACPMNLVVSNDMVFWTNAGTVIGSTTTTMVRSSAWRRMEPTLGSWRLARIAPTGSRWVRTPSIGRTRASSLGRAR